MSDLVTLEFSIPSDNEGYVLLQCSYCGSLFKIPSETINDVNFLYYYCPSCGLISENYLTDEAIELAMAKTHNYAMSVIHQSFKDLERKTKSKAVSFKVNSKISPVEERSLITRVDLLTVAYFDCCKKTAKVHPLVRLSSGYCPYCGVIDFDIK